jgi:hypothetical protein
VTPSFRPSHGWFESLPRRKNVVEQEADEDFMSLQQRFAVELSLRRVSRRRSRAALSYYFVARFHRTMDRVLT